MCSLSTAGVQATEIVTKVNAELNPQICINIHPDAVPPIHAESYHVATDKGPLQVPVYF